jgi:hypothetical protein
MIIGKLAAAAIVKASITMNAIVDALEGDCRAVSR